MKLDEIRAMMATDCKIDRSCLDEESLKTPLLHGKYYRMMMDEARTLKGLEMEMARLKRSKFEYYTGKSEDSVYEDRPLYLKVTRQDLDIYLDSDEEMQELNGRIFIQKSKVDLIQDFIKQTINNRGFMIRDAIAFERFKNGLS